MSVSSGNSEEREALASDSGDLFDEPLDIQGFSDYESIEDYCADPAYAAYCDDPNFYTPGSICGDGMCDPGEEAICLLDCSDAGDMLDDAGDAAAIFTCGDGVCDPSEEAICPFDCGGGDLDSGDDLNLGAVCGNFICEAGEDSASCPSDCEG